MFVLNQNGSFLIGSIRVELVWKVNHYFENGYLYAGRVETTYNYITNHYKPGIGKSEVIDL